MMGHIPASTLPTLPSHTPVQICTACAEGNHEQLLHTEHCDCPCHGVRPKADEVPA